MIRGAPRTRQARWRAWRLVAVRAGRRLLRLDDSPRRIAVGSAAGLFCAPLPMVGQPLLAALLARLAGGNLLAAIAGTFVSNPLTSLPIWYGCYRIGRGVVQDERPAIGFARVSGLLANLNDLPLIESLGAGYGLVREILAPLLCGTLLVGLALAVGGFFAVRALVGRWHRHRAARLQRWRPADRDVDRSQAPPDPEG